MCSDEFAAQAGPEFFRSRYSIGLWFWEVERFPASGSRRSTTSTSCGWRREHTVRAISPLSPVPVTKITLPVEMPPVVPRTRAELDLPEGFLFLFSFDHHSVFERKNPLAVIDAFKRAFEPDDGAVLAIKSINAASAPQDHQRLLAAAPRVAPTCTSSTATSTPAQEL